MLVPASGSGRRLFVAIDKEATDVGDESDQEHHAEAFTQPIEDGYLVLRRHEPQRCRRHALQPDLHDACAGK